ncbi:hypothetical protein Mapa_012368 [Marchantia paleacea]|nr:hypothetical protein Mapa_012368 [Marchantia paleacea]
MSRGCHCCCKDVSTLSKTWNALPLRGYIHLFLFRRLMILTMTRHQMSMSIDTVVVTTCITQSIRDQYVNNVFLFVFSYSRSMNATM